MKKQRLIGLLIVLVAVVGSAVYYFSHEDELFEDGPLAQTVQQQPGVYIHSGRTGAWNEPVSNFDQEMITIETIDSYSGTTYAENFQEKINQITLGTFNKKTYTLFVREDFGTVPSSPVPIASMYELYEAHQEPSEQFFVLNTTVNVRDGYNEVVRTYQNVDSKRTYTLPIMRFWFIGNADPIQAIKALIKVDEQSLMTSGACDVNVFDYEEYQQDTPKKQPDDNPFEREYQIIFKPEKLNDSALQKLTNTSLAGVCGEYGQQMMQWGLRTGTFTVDQGVLIYLPPKDDVWGVYNLIRISVQ